MTDGAADEKDAFDRAAAAVRDGADAGADAAVLVARMTIEEKLDCLDLGELAVRVDGAWIHEPGPYELTIGRHAHDPAAATITAPA